MRCGLEVTTLHFGRGKKQPWQGWPLKEVGLINPVPSRASSKKGADPENDAPGPVEEHAVVRKGLLSRTREWLREYGYVLRRPLIYSTTAGLLVGLIVGLNEFAVETRASVLREQELQTYAKLIATHTSRFDYTALASITELLQNTEYVEHVRIEDRFGNVVPLGGSGTASPGEPPAGRMRSFTLKLEGRVDQSFGTLTVWISQGALSNPFVQGLKAILLVFPAFFILSTALLAHYANRFVVGPLHEFKRAVSSTLETGRPVPTELDETTHIGRFATEFNEMQESLTEVQTDLVGKVDALNKQTKLGEQHVSVLTRMLTGFGTCVRHFSPEGAVRDYGKPIPAENELALPQEFPDSAKQLREWLIRENRLDENTVSVVPTGDVSETDLLFRVEITNASNSVILVSGLQLNEYGNILSVADVSLERQMERERVRKHKMEALGVMASGISHDFNNVLAIIIGSLDILTDEKNLSDKSRRLVKTATEASWRGSGIIHSILAYAREGHLATEVRDVGKIIETLIPIAASGLPTEILLSHEAAANLYCRVNPDLLESSILNLLGNAKDAIANTGTVKLVARVAPGDLVKSAGLEPGDYVAISILDSGPGIPDHLLDKVFDPFFTTKPRGRGTGLGLSSVYGFANESGGTLHYQQSELGGAEFSIILPLVTSAVTGPQTSEIEKESGHSNKHVLVVEDEVSFLEVLVTFLGHFGYEVTGVGSLADAREHLSKEHGPPFDVVVTDARLGDGNGVELVEEYSDRIEFIVMSGNARDELAFGGKVAHFLYKPFQLKDLIRLLQRG